MKHIKTVIECLQARFPKHWPLTPSMLDTIPQLDDVNESIKRFQAPKSYFTSIQYLRTYDRADWSYSHPDLRLFTWRFLRALRSRGLPMYVHTAYRSPAVQLAAYKAGNSKIKSGGSHQRGCSIDLVHAVHHWNIPADDAFWYYVGSLGEQIARQMPAHSQPIVWGGRWKKPDVAHWQLKNWREFTVYDPPSTPLRISPYSDQMRFG